jgi:hypothetical protein
MEAASTSETSANLYQTTRRNTPEDSDLHTRRCENMKSHLGKLFSTAHSLTSRLHQQTLATPYAYELLCVISALSNNCRLRKKEKNEETDIQNKNRISLLTFSPQEAE